MLIDFVGDVPGWVLRLALLDIIRFLLPFVWLSIILVKTARRHSHPQRNDAIVRYEPCYVDDNGRTAMAPDNCFRAGTRCLLRCGMGRCARMLPFRRTFLRTPAPLNLLDATWRNTSRHRWRRRGFLPARRKPTRAMRTRLPAGAHSTRLGCLSGWLTMGCRSGWCLLNQKWGVSRAGYARSGSADHGTRSRRRFTSCAPRSTSLCTSTPVFGPCDGTRRKAGTPPPTRGGHGCRKRAHTVTGT